ncbi:S26 family signal peptidase [Curtobacterium sp. SP.BCo]|uniref:S26 family signal peptidase n=1 Tax=Curtobacterium sp. SP.BCo TaxID=3435229 RepID=UPI003F73A31F
MSQTAAISLHGVLPRQRLTARPATALETLLAWSTAVVAGLLLVAAMLFVAGGGRWFVVETPSMGEAVPVGTLVVDQPVRVDTLRVGDIVSFRTAANPGTTYTHRIVSIDADGGIHTRGDVNGATDPWTLGQDEIVGAPVALVPHVGWVLRAAPILLVGTLLIWILTSPFTDRVTRASLRIAGGALTASYAAFILKPFVNVATIENTSTAHSVTATVISSGVFPVRVSGHGSDSVHLVDGEVGRVTIHELTANGHYQLSSGIDLDPAGWALLLAVCAVPLVLCLWVGREHTVRAA